MLLQSMKILFQRGRERRKMNETFVLRTELALLPVISCRFVKEALVNSIKNWFKPAHCKTTPAVFHSTVNTSGILLCLLIKYHLYPSGNPMLMTAQHSTVVSVLALLKNYSPDS